MRISSLLWKAILELVFVKQKRLPLNVILSTVQTAYKQVTQLSNLQKGPGFSLDNGIFQKLPSMGFGNPLYIKNYLLKSVERHSRLQEGSRHQLDVEIERNAASKDGRTWPATNSLGFQRLANSFFL